MSKHEPEDKKHKVTEHKLNGMLKLIKAELDASVERAENGKICFDCYMASVTHHFVTLMIEYRARYLDDTPREALTSVGEVMLHSLESAQTAVDLANVVHNIFKDVADDKNTAMGKAKAKSEADAFLSSITNKGKPH